MEETTRPPTTTTTTSSEFCKPESKNKSRLDLRFAAYAAKRAGASEDDNDDNLLRGGSSSKVEVNQFWTDFNALAKKKNNVAAASGGVALPLKQLEANIEAAQQLLNKSIHFLPAYDLRSAQTTINSLTEELTKQREVTGCGEKKQKFTFKRSRPADKTPQTTQSQPPAPEPLRQSAVPESNSAEADLLRIGDEAGFRDLCNQTLVVSSSDHHVEDSTQQEAIDNSGGDMALTNLTDCRVYICKPLRALRAHNLVNCHVFVGPVAGSALIYDCRGCRFSLAARQLRVHNTTDSDFYLAARSGPIIEHCERVRFAPYNFSYPCLAAQLREAGLETAAAADNDQWCHVGDFDRPAATTTTTRQGEETPPPAAWSLVQPEAERQPTVFPPPPPPQPNDS